MAESFERIICKDKGKYFEIGFTSGLLSLILYLPLMFLGGKFFKVEGSLLKDIIVSPLIFHISFATVYAFLIGLKKELNSNKFFIITLLVGLIGEILYPVNMQIFAYAIILFLSWFLYAVIFLVLEKKIALDTNEAFEAKIMKEKEEKEKNKDKK